MTGERGELAYWLALVRMPGVGVVTARRLLEHFPTPLELFQSGARACPERVKLGDAARDWLREPDWGIIDLDLAWAQQPDRHLISLHDPRYPPLLNELPDPPLVLFVHGDPELLRQPQLAIVGTRNPTRGGADTAADFARHLAASGLVITSGLALGIDAASHQGALAARDGHTIAVTGTGLDRVYPARHRNLAHEIAGRGALVTEFPPGTAPRPENFPRRNRLISGLSLGTLVVEAAIHSGSLITARLATEQGREVFAIPGSIHNPQARGCHALIRLGAKLVETAADIIEELGGWTATHTPLTPLSGTPPHRHADDPAYAQLLGALGYEPAAIDTLVERSGLTPEQVSSMLLVLELHGQVAPTAGGLYTRLS